MEEPILNWAGLPPHPTDNYVHWTDKDPVARMHELRDLWKAALFASSISSLEKLLEAAYIAGQRDNDE